MTTAELNGDRLTRRNLIEIGYSSMLGAGLSTIIGQRAKADEVAPRRRAKSVLFLFLFGGPSHIDTFDLKPEAPDECRGEFGPIDTSVPGLQICEHLPILAQRMHHWALVRSMTCNPTFGDHRMAVHGLLGGVDELPVGSSLSACAEIGRRGVRPSNIFEDRTADCPPVSCFPAKWSIPPAAFILPKMAAFWVLDSIHCKSKAIRPIPTIASMKVYGCRLECRSSV